MRIQARREQDQPAHAILPAHLQGIAAMMKKLYISDLDGTLLDRESRLSAATERMLQQLLTDGLDFTVATLRSVSSVMPLFRNIQLNLPIIELNGAFITDLNTGEKLVTNALDTALRLPLHEALMGSGVSPIILTRSDAADKLCFCDQRIDIPMFRISDLAIAVQNAPEDVKNAAGRVIGPHDTDAVAKYLCEDYYGKQQVFGPE